MNWFVRRDGPCIVKKGGSWRFGVKFHMVNIIINGLTDDDDDDDETEFQIFAKTVLYLNISSVSLFCVTK